MQLRNAVQHVFGQLSATLQLLDNSKYCLPSEHLSGATIGQHTRHIIEMFHCLLHGYETGSVNYEKRKRDVRIETDKEFALQLLNATYADLNRPNKALVLEASYHDDTNDMLTIDSNFEREIAYNLEHTIHHMALIKVGILELSDIELPEGFGVASSTMKHRKQCAQ